jgi:Protein of unknown function (DUF4231)
MVDRVGRPGRGNKTGLIRLERLAVDEYRLAGLPLVTVSEDVMTDEQFEEYLNERYRSQINYYGSKAGWNKRMYNWFQWSVIIVSAVVPVMVVGFEKEYKWVAAVLSVLLAIGTSALKAFKFQENWLNFRQLAEALKQEKHFLDADLGAYATAADKHSVFVDHVESLISRENAIWTNVHQQKEEPANTDKR